MIRIAVAEPRSDTRTIMAQPERNDDYVLGTHDEEVTRLGLQHRAWRAYALDAWRRAGFRTGQTLVDIGCGPGWASLDLAEIVGPAGRVVAIDRSRRFLQALERARTDRQLPQIEPIELDLDVAALPALAADGAWARWAFAFLREPRRLLGQVAATLKPGGVFVVHEYFDYSTWRVSPRSEEIEAFVQLVIRAWRDSGGEPDVGLDLPRWLRELGFDVRLVRPIVDVIAPRDFAWEWPLSFVRSGVQRLQDLGYLTTGASEEILHAFADAERQPSAMMVTPAVLEIIAVRA
jgi:SAM-dependent methyltransferase